MTPQTHIIGQDYSVYYDLIVIVLILIVCMIACTLWLARQKQSFRFVSMVWVGFILLISLGSLGVSRSIHTQRLIWRDSCSRLVATYANIVMQLDHWKVQAGHTEVFSDWSPPFFPTTDNSAPIPMKWDRNPAPDQPPPLTKLAVPDGGGGYWQNLMPHDNDPLQCQRRNQWAVTALTGNCQAFARCTKQIAAYWNPVPNATTYRLQWGAFRDEATEWMTVYVGAKPFCTITAPEGVNIALRVRAEDGTPEDDPIFNEIIDVLDFPVRVDCLVGYTYTLRVSGPDEMQYIAAPISDANHNNYIDTNERPNDIGELFETTPLSQYVCKHGQRTLNLDVYTDDWGRWFTIAEPLWTPDKKLDGLLGMDFNVDLIRRRMLFDRMYPLSLFVLASLSYFGAVVIVSSLQVRAKTISRLAEVLQNTNVELVQSQQAAEKALQVKSLFLNNMSHEFRTPINVMLGFTDILARHVEKVGLGKEETYVEAIKQIRESGQNLIGMVENVLNMAALGENQTFRLTFTSVHLHKLISDIADTFQSRAESKSLTLTVTISPDAPEWIKSDPVHIWQVLTHIVANAIKFTQKGGVAIRYDVLPEPGMLAISVSDTGIGIESGLIQHIFEPFLQSDSTLTRKHSGAGIGLTVARHSAEMLNGGISIESQRGRGSTFTFIFPGTAIEPPPQEIPKVQEEAPLPEPQPVLKETAPPPSEKKTEPEKQTEAKTETEKQAEKQAETGAELVLAGCRILYVEDTRINQMIMETQMRGAGAFLELAENGQIGIDKIANAEKSGKPYDIILMDMQMPVLDGYDATKHLRTNGYSKPIIAVTAHALPWDREEALEAGCDEYIAKPIDFARLIKMIREFWKTASPQAEEDAETILWE